MSRSGYIDDSDYDQWAMIRWRGAVASAFRGKRGQAFLREMLAALDALPEKRLLVDELQDPYDSNLVCAIGAVGRIRGVDMQALDPEDHDDIAAVFNISHDMACEIMFTNDEGFGWQVTPEERFYRMRAWIVGELI
jgi:hypothetical protein